MTQGILKLPRNNTYAIRWLAMKSDADDSAVTDATVTMTVKDAAGNTVSGGGSISMPHTSGGTYRGLVPSTLALTQGTSGTIVVTATSPEGNGEANLPYIVVSRGANG